MNFKHTFIASLLLISSALQAAEPAQKIRLNPKKVALVSLYSALTVGSGAAAAICAAFSGFLAHEEIGTKGMQKSLVNNKDNMTLFLGGSFLSFNCAVATAFWYKKAVETLKNN